MVEGALEPKFVIGFRLRSFLRIIVWFTISLALFIFFLWLLPKFPAIRSGESTSQRFFTGGIYFAPDLAGLVSVLFLVVDFSTLISCFALLFWVIGWLMRGELRLFEDRIEWKKKGRVTTLAYDQLQDVYLGHIAMPSTVFSPTGAYQQRQVRLRKAFSFYIDKRKFFFIIDKYPGIFDFLEAKIPKANFDVLESENE
ncbi:hypothetical protein ApAK_04125 [Thermoplasmatales archaeon AK]|nr:hypothetical protein [Thermoplasmatales archaeon AK]